MAKKLKLNSGDVDAAVQILIKEGVVRKSKATGKLAFVKQPYAFVSKGNTRLAALDEKKRASTNNADLKTKPSQRPQFQKYQQKKMVKGWHAGDFLGLYLNQFKEFYGEEDFELCLAHYKAFAQFTGRLKSFLVKAFNGDQTELRNYILWVFQVWLSSQDADWFDGQMTFGLCFDTRKGMLLKKFKTRNKRKGQKRVRQKEESDWSKSDNWREHLDGGTQEDAD